MKVLLISSSYLPKKGGVELVVHNLAKSLSKNHEVNVLTTENFPRFNFSCSSITENIDQVPVNRIWMNLPTGIKGVLAFPIRFITSKIALKKYFKQYNPDLIHYHFPDDSMLYIVPNLLNKKVPVVLSIHGNDLHLFSKKPYLKKLLEKLLVNSVKVIVNSEYMKSELIKKDSKYWDKIVIVPNGIDIDLYDSIISPPKQKQIFYVGRLVWKKGVDILIKAFNESKFEGNLIIEGIGEQYDELVALAQSSKKADRIIFLKGSLSVEDKIRYMKSSVFGVIPSRIEPFGIVALEFMASKTPIISSQTGGLQNILENEITCLFFENENIKDLTSQIDKLILDSSLRDKLIINGYQEVQKYSIDAVNNEYIRIYEGIIK